MRILSINGGGLCVMYAATILLKIESEFGINLTGFFDFFAGSSSGSFVASALATGHKVSDCVKSVQRDSKQLLMPIVPNWCSFLNAFFPKFSTKNLDKFTHKYFNNMLLQDVKKPLLITAADIIKGKGYNFHSPYSKAYNHQRKIPVKKCIQASMAAPTFYAPVYFSKEELGDKERLLADGGLTYNNPALLSVIEAITKFGMSVEEIHVLSLGTGRVCNYFTLKDSKSKFWGVCKWGKKLPSLLIQASVTSQSHILQKMIHPSKYLELDMNLMDIIDIGNPETIKMMSAMGVEDFNKHYNRIADFLSSSKQ